MKPLNSCIIYSLAIALAGISSSVQSGTEGSSSKVTMLGDKSPHRRATASEDKRPNILLIVVDDLGYTDLGAFGSEIPTPNIDGLAARGMLLTSFYTAPNCSPARAMLLSGTDNHVAGLGNMAEVMSANQRGRPGYEGYLNNRIATLAEVLGDSGYSTYMTGKWHLGSEDSTSPSARGFQRSFAMLQGGAGHFDNMLAYFGRERGDRAKYREDGELLSSLPKGFYSSKFYAERMIEYVEQGRDTGRPFFGYLAFTAPHWPLQAPATSVERHRGKYDGGWDQLFEQRMAGLKRKGIISTKLKPSPNILGVPAWENLSDEARARQARIMEVYAAMIEDVDVYVGKVIDYLRSIGEYENTLTIFLSDNGAEGHEFQGETAPPGLKSYLTKCCDNSFENIGAPDSYVWPGHAWARASVGPWKLFKGFPSEGGIRAPAIVHYPKVIGAGVNSDFTTVKDVMPTVLDLVDIEHPAPVFKGREVEAMQGTSLLSRLSGRAIDEKLNTRTMGWELFGKKALRYGHWKIVQQPESDFFKPMRKGDWTTQRWRLYNLAEDPTEHYDVADANPDVVEIMLAHWESYLEENAIVLPETTSGY